MRGAALHLLVLAAAWGLAPAAHAGTSPPDTVLIDNDIPLGDVGHFSVLLTCGGESTEAIVTAEPFVSGQPITTDVLFDYGSFVDTGEMGAGFRITDTADGRVLSVGQVAQDPNDEDAASCSGVFTLDDFETPISWTVRSAIPDGGDTMTSTFTFSRDGSIGPLRFFQHLDEDVLGVDDDVFFTRGSAATLDLELFTFDETELFGVSHGGAYSSGQGLVNATFAGFAADVFNEIIAAIEGSGQPVAPDGMIDTTDLPDIVLPIGAANGPADVVSVLAWDVFGEASNATIVTTFGGVPRADVDAPLCESLVDNGDGTFSGTARDDAFATDSGIASVTVEGQNLQVIPFDFEPGDPTVSFDVEAIDPAQPAAGTVTATDGNGNTCSFAPIELPAMPPVMTLGQWVEDGALLEGETSQEVPFTLGFFPKQADGVDVYDLTDPSAPALVGGFTDPGTCDGAFFADSVELVDDDLLLLSGGGCGLLVLEVDASDPSAVALTLLDIVPMPGWAQQTSAESLFLNDVLRTFAYVANDDKGLRVVDITIPTASVELGVIGEDDEDFGDVIAVDSEVRGGVPIVYAGTFAAFRVIDASDPAAPVELTSFPYPDENDIAQGITVVPQLDLAIVAVWLGGLSVLDITGATDPVSPSAPTERQRIPTQAAFYRTAVPDSAVRAFAAEGQCGLVVFDIDNTQAEPLIESMQSPLPVAGGVADCGPPYEMDGPWAWSVDATSSGLVVATFGILDPRDGGFQLFDFAPRIPLRGGVVSVEQYLVEQALSRCGLLGIEPFLVLAGLRLCGLRRRSRSRP